MCCKVRAWRVGFEPLDKPMSSISRDEKETMAKPVGNKGKGGKTAVSDFVDNLSDEHQMLVVLTIVRGDMGADAGCLMLVSRIA